ncbi:MAG: F0F1 ATP synthase subunit B [Candidatus Omnitrophica bacterium]|nr:F0F1 ATP synthase subunit B [Candidatus Omnitrophota bacterium]
MELLKLLSANEMVAQAISFLILLLLMRIFVWKKLLGILDQRKEKISSEFKNIEDAKLAASKLQEDLENRLKSIDELSRSRINEAIREGEKLAIEIKKSAHQDAQKIVEDARSYTKYELSKVKEGLKEEIIELVMKATEDVIEEKMTEEVDKKIVENFLNRVDKA